MNMRGKKLPGLSQLGVDPSDKEVRLKKIWKKECLMLGLIFLFDDSDSSDESERL
jgi:hypothetical protein